MESILEIKLRNKIKGKLILVYEVWQARTQAEALLALDFKK
jgi:hypothetical protein